MSKRGVLLAKYNFRELKSLTINAKFLLKCLLLQYSKTFNIDITMIQKAVKRKQASGFIIYTIRNHNMTKLNFDKFQVETKTIQLSSLIWTRWSFHYWIVKSKRTIKLTIVLRARMRAFHQSFRKRSTYDCPVTST